jgi:hypothetical protein
MKLGELLKNVRETIRDWGFFFVTATLLNIAIFNGVVHKKAIVENEFTTYTKFFEDSAKLYGVKIDMNNLVIGFVDSYPIRGWVGLCERPRGATKFVSFQKAYFNSRSPEAKYALVLHELGHCVLDRDHVPGYLKNNCPKSLMHPSDGLFGCFFKDQDYYLKELFGLL